MPQLSTTVRARLQEKSSTFYRVFNTHDGKQVLKALLDAFDGEDLRGATVEDTYYNLGARDVVVYINQLMRQADETEMDEEAFK